MSLSLSDARQRLLSGGVLPWEKFDKNRAGWIQLPTAGARRLLHYLLSCDQTKVAEANEALFDGLVAAWENDVYDPAEADASSGPASMSGPWRLARLEAFGFGGLTLPGGPTFMVQFNGENWCLEGHNGSGKTSLASAIIWALTGYRCLDQEGLVADQGIRTPVYSDSGAQIGDWPAIVAYPSTTAQLAGTAETWVRLIFQDPDGNFVQAYRRLVAAPNANPVIDAEIAPELMVAPELLEVGLLMPARLARIGFGGRSETIYEAVKLLTGLDQLAAIADGASNFANGAKRFMKFAVDHGIQAIEARMKLYLDRAAEEAKKANFDLRISGRREDKEYARGLRDTATRGAEQAAAHLGVLASDIASDLNTANADDRAKVKDAVGLARGILQEPFKGVTIFDAWKALKTAHGDAGFQNVPDVIREAKDRLADAIAWDKRQSKDHKLRLKALASRYFEPAQHAHEDAACPLCESRLSDEKRKALATELNELKAASAEAERKLTDVCTELEKKIRDTLSHGINSHFTLLAEMQPRDAFLQAVKERFTEAPPFSTVLTGMAKFASNAASKIAVKLPIFQYTASPDQCDMPVVAVGLAKYIADVERLSSLVGWWFTHREQFGSAWNELKGSAPGRSDLPTRTLEGRLASLEAALEKVTPLDDLAKALNDAATEADKWLPIYETQRTRQAVAKALDPLKQLRLLVTIETARSVSSLSSRMKVILERIHFRERLAFEDASLGKKKVQIAGSFDRGIRIDASSVANSSWLRAILWAFILALREHSIESIGGNPFPLILLDDPQVTFDPRNKRKWAAEIARLGNADPVSHEAAQILLITHERQFFQILINSEKLEGQQGLIARPSDTSKVATIIHGNSLASTYNEAIASNSDEKGHAYVRDVRIYCEQLLRIMLRAEGPEVCEMSPGKLTSVITLRRDGKVPPFTHPSFGKLLDLVCGGGHGKSMKLINEAAHEFDGTIGVAEATDVRTFWEAKAQPCLHRCFKIFAEFEAYHGEPRLFPWMDNVVEFPLGNAKEIRNVHLQRTGIAAAAKTDGRAGDGLITIAELSKAQKITLYNHDIYQLAAGTLDPVAEIGDGIIVSNYAKVHARNLVVVAFERQLLARRYNEVEIHPHIAVLTGHTTDPTAIPQPVIAPRERMAPRKIVGTLFARSRLPIPRRDENVEFASLPDLSVIRSILQDAKLFQVNGRSAEPVALDGQFIITQPIDLTVAGIAQADGHLVIAVDESGARYFKRFRPHGTLVVLESLNPDGTSAAELLSLRGEAGFPRLTTLLEVVGVLFELP